MKIGDEGRAMAMKDGFMDGSKRAPDEQFCIKGHVYHFIVDGPDSYAVCDQMDVKVEDPNYNHSMRKDFFDKYFQKVGWGARGK